MAYLKNDFTPYKYKAPIPRFRHFSKVRNYAIYRCHRTKNTIAPHVPHEDLVLIHDITHHKFTFTKTHFYFESEDDLFMFRMAYPVKTDK